jgi:uncharacterized protein
MEHLKVGMKLPGIVTNITAFGCFVDIGVHQDGLIHISQLSDKFIKDPNEVVKVHQHVTVYVLEVDIDRKRISLSMKPPGAAPATTETKQPEPKRPASPKPVNKDKRPPTTSTPQKPGVNLADRLNLGRWN